MAEEQVTAPDQHARPNLKWIRIGGVLAILVMLSLTSPFNNHPPGPADAFLVGVAALIAVLLIADVVLRRNGLRR